MGSNSKRYDDKIWWEEVSTIVEVNNKPVDKVLLKSDLKNGDGVVIKFGGKAKKLFKGTVEFSAVTDVGSPNMPEHTLSPSKLKSKSPSKMPVQPPVKKQKLELPRYDKLTAQKSGAILATGSSGFRKQEIPTSNVVSDVGVTSTSKNLCDEMKISTLQLQLQMERHQRSIEAIERKMEIKIEEVLTKLDQPLRNINGDINNLKVEVKQITGSCDKLLQKQNEIQKVQDQLVSRQDQLFNKQDQIQSTLAGDFLPLIEHRWYHGPVQAHQYQIILFTLSTSRHHCMEVVHLDHLLHSTNKLFLMLHHT